jgi:acyl transferase domain-containing protein/NAD(P)-dependent dehydrogenase (short-subunit alcohol dehydrogenase family)/SAM-dependent methyltransferase
VLSLTKDNPIVDDHRVHGVRTLPGVTFLDLVLRAAAASGFDLATTELRDVLFVEPVVTTDAFDREVVIELAPDGPCHRVVATSRRVSPEPTEQAWVRHLEATIWSDRPPLSGTLGAVPDAEPRDVADVYALGGAAGVEHRAYMRCTGTLRSGDGWVRTDLALGAEAAADSAEFLLHPALLDGSTMQSYPLAFAGQDADGRPLIPLHIASFRAADALGDGCVVDLRLTSPVADVVRTDIGLHARDGRLLARFDGLTLKRVRSRSAFTRLTDAGRAPDTIPAAPMPAASVQAGPAEASRAEAGPADPSMLVEQLVETIRDTVGDPRLEVDPGLGFYELGLESAHLLALVRAMEERWSIQLYPTLLFEHTTVDAVAEYLIGVLPEAGRPRTSAGIPDAEAETHYLSGFWKHVPLAAPRWSGSLLVIGADTELAGRLPGPVVHAGPETDLRLLLAGLDEPPAGIIHIGPSHPDDLAGAVDDACAQVLAVAQALPPGAVRVPLLHVSSAPIAAAVAGLARTIRLEQPRIAVTAVECEGPPDAGALVAELAAGDEHWVRYDTRGQRRYVRRYHSRVPRPVNGPHADGVYLITGGAGGVGRALASWLVTEVGATVVATGRHRPVEPLPAGVEFVVADVTVPADVQRLVSDVRARHGRISGVLHAAGILRDSLLPTKTAAGLRAVLAPKVRGTILLDEATRTDPPDFFALFSSITGIAGNAGQADYAAANAFLDAYARTRGFVSIAWPLWADGGMRTDAATEALFRRQGQVPLPTAAAIDAFRAALGAPGAETVVLHGDFERMPAALGLPLADPDPVAAAEPAATPDRQDIAIIGVAGRYPMSENLDGFWANLLAARDCVTEIPADRWDLPGFYEPERAPGRSYSKWGGFIDGVDEFDPQFFRITPREAAGMDPQERLFLQTVWHTMEDAGVTRADLAGRAVGVFAGAMFTQYQMLGLAEPERLPVLPTSFSSAVANRVSYFLDLRGPSIALDTMCSSSLTAIHLACESLRSGDCELAFAGGVNVILHPYKYLHLSQVGFVSSDGRCRSFGAGGDGYVPGEGVGAVLLKPLARALADGDRVHAVIRGSAVNHGGRASGFFVPNPAAQHDVVRRALDRADVAPDTVGYVEAHGTGTALGDPVEITGLQKIFDGTGPCPIGSVKSGIGHLESAAGIAGLCKVLLQLRHRTLAPSLHAEEPNPAVDWAGSPLRVQREAAPWPRPGTTPRRAGISAFGAGGANGHLVVEDFEPAATPRVDDGGPALVLLSARTADNLQELAERYLAFVSAGPTGASVELTELLADLLGLRGAPLDQGAELDELGLDAADLRRLEHALAERFPGADVHVDARSTPVGLAGALAVAGSVPALADIAYTSQFGREAMAERVALVVSDLDEMRDALRHFLDGAADHRVHRGTAVGRGAPADGTDLTALARAWASGAPVDFSALHAGRPRHRIALPLYPFTRMRCWIDRPQARPVSPGPVTPPPAPAVAQEPVAMHVPVWEPAPVAAASAPAGPAVVIHTEATAVLAARIAAHHPDTRIIGRRDLDDLHGLGTPRTVYFLIGEEGDDLAQAERHGVHALLRCARHWAGVPELDWRVVTVSSPYTAGLAGFARVMANEHPQWNVSVLDFTEGSPQAEPIVTEPAGRGVPVTYRDGVRHRRVLRPAPPATLPDPIRPGGHYLIVGGAGGIGLEVARYLVRERDARVTLVGRRPLVDDQVAAIGPNACYVRADAADVEQLRGVLAGMGDVHGAIHMALAQHDRLVRNLTDDELQASLTAKSGVAVALVEALRDHRPDFLLLFSSAQSFLGDSGLANYAAGSTFLDAYAHAMDARQPYLVRSINWGFWGTVGSVASEEYRARLTAAGFHSISPAQGVATLVAALRTTAPQVVAVPGAPALLARLGVAGGAFDRLGALCALDAAQERAVADFHALDGRMREIAHSRLLALLDEMDIWTGEGVTPRYQRLVRTILDQLTDAGLVTVRQGRYRPEPGALALARAGGQDAALAELANAPGESTVFVALLRHCLAHYPQLLRGELLATDLLFPKSGTSLMAGIYKDNPISDAYNDVLNDAVLAYISERLPSLASGEKIRLLEVGSGTGGTSAGLLHAIREHGDHLEYHYTDLSIAFLAHGQREYAPTYPFLRFKRLDLDADLVAQGFAEGGFDLVVAANVMHATRDVGRAVRNVRRVLRAGGWLLLNELTTVTTQATVTYGLFDGWWNHDDTEVRLPGSPLLDVPGWRGLLTAAGYGAVTAVPEQDGKNFQHVVVARAGITPGLAAPAATATAASSPVPAPVAAPAVRATEPPSGFADEILALTSRASGIPVGELDLDREIGEYGFDSVSYSLLAGTINEQLGLDVTPALFYETATLRALVDRLAAEFAASHPAPPRPPAAAEPPVPQPSPVRSPWSSERPETPGHRTRTTFEYGARSGGEPLAIVGVSALLPGSADLDDFWEHLVAGDDLVGEVPPDRWDWRTLPPEVIARWGGFVADVDRFDPLFFGLSPAEARSMDPQHRLVLQGVWTALEDAGLAPGALAGSDTGLFIGAGSTDYDEVWRAAGRSPDVYSATANTHSILVNRVSYLLDLHGPSEPVNTGCSSSLVALHRAAEAVRAGECEMAVAGGINLMLTPHNHELLSPTGMLSPAGRCRPFDAAADGFVRGEGFGLVVLTTARRAAEARHRVRAWLRGTAVNHGGRARSLTAPNPASQAALIVRAHERAGVDPGTIGYLETHGTGTELGDPVEINGLKAAFDELFRRTGTGRPAEPYCALGAVKGNIGHLESAAGIAGVLKVLLAMERGVLPPIAHLREPNPHLRLAGSPFRLIDEPAPWPDGPRRAGVSSFGYGGVGAHVVLEAAEDTLASAAGVDLVFPLSARTPEALRRYAANLRSFVERRPDADLADIAYTLQAGRDSMSHRLAIAGTDRQTLIAALAAFAGGGVHPAIVAPAGTDAAARWVAGGDPAWTGDGRLIPLPTYPFEGRRCWVPGPVEPVEPVQEVLPFQADREDQPVQRIEREVQQVEPVGLYVPRWPVLADVPRRAPGPGPVWLVGAEAPAPGGDTIRLDPGEVTDEVLGRLPTPAAVVFAAGPAPAAGSLLDEVTEAEERGVLALFRLVRHLAGRPGAAGGLALTVLTREAFGVGGPVRAPASGALWGLLRSVRRECERWRITAVDLGATDTAPPGLLTVGPGDFAYRDGRWHRQVLHEVTAQPDQQVFRTGGSYLIVGGTGDIGLDVAEHLVRDHRARVALVGRSVLGDDRRGRIARIDPTGEHLMHLRADAGDTHRMRAVIEQVCERFGGLHGVLHTVTVPCDRSLAAMDESWFSAGLAAKSRTTAALADALGERRLDFLALFSSAQSFIGNPGQAAYAAGSVAQDALAHALAGRLPYPVRALDWGAWAGSTLATRHRDRLARAGIHPISPAAGIDALGRVLSVQEVQVAVVSGSDEFLAKLGFERPGEPRTGQWLPDLTADLHALVCEVAGVGPAELTLDTPLRDFGFDSISYTQLSHRANVRLDLELTPASFFGVATTAELVAKIARDEADALHRHYQASIETAAEARPVMVATTAPRETGIGTAAERPVAAATVAPRETEPARPDVEDAEDAVAVVGMAAMVPGSDDVAEFWAHLVAGDDLVTEIPADRWDWRRIDGDPEPGEFRTRARWGGFLKRIDLFDPAFFGISATEAVAMDPQHRLVLHATWTAIEDAGIRPSSLAGSDTGVFLGSGTYDYFEVQHAFGVPLDGYNTVGRSHAIMSNRVSYLLDLHGPSETIDTACSSSLVAVHRAVEAIRHGDCTAALAGGVNVIASPTLFVDMSQADMLSPEGRCRSFAEGADGIVRAEGVGVVLLKRLSAARADGDVIHGVIRGTAINHGGRTNSLTAPNPDAQAECVVRAHRRAGVDPRTVTYVETHGTGTELGDPIEVDGLRSAFATLYRDWGATVEAPHVALGAVKSNTGHLEAAAGVTGLIKVLLALRHETLPGNLHIDRVNPYIRLDGSPLRVLRERERWLRPRTPDGTEAPLRAGVSSFGLGGVNAHVVVEEFREERTSPGNGPELFVLSAHTPERLRAYVRRLLDRLPDDVDLPALAHTLRTGRDPLPERLAIVAQDRAALAKAATDWLTTGTASGVFTGVAGDATIAMLLDGPEGEQYLRASIAAGRLDKLARLWAGGADIDWPAPSGSTPRRVSAPTYPFAPESYWITPGPQFDQAQAWDSGMPVAEPAPASAIEPARAIEPAAGVEPISGPEPEPVQAAEVRSDSAGSGPEESDPEIAILARIREVLAMHLGTKPERLPVDRVLADVGADSLSLRRLSRQLAADYGVQVPAKMFSTGQTLRVLARTVLDAFGPRPAPTRDGTGPTRDEAGAGRDGAGAGQDRLDAVLEGLSRGNLDVDGALASLQERTGR